MKRLLAIQAVAWLAAVASATAVSPTELGAFLAGRALPPTSPLAALQTSPEYQEHARQYAAQWFRYNERYFAPMRAWSAAELVPRIGQSSQVTYLFSGPDLISADHTGAPDALKGTGRNHTRNNARRHHKGKENNKRLDKGFLTDAARVLHDSSKKNALREGET